MKKLLLIPFVFFGAILVAGPAVAQSTPPAGAVLTYHNDHFRTGWQQQETILTNSGLTNFVLLKTVKLLDQIDAQPLVVSGITTLNSGKDTAIVVDESNNVYLIDPVSGNILNTPKGLNLGSPVPKPLNCGNNGDHVGINSTPVIDWASKTLFVIAYVNVNGTTPTYFVHALDLTNLALMDKVTPVQVAASHKLTNGSTFNFSATNQRQRAGLLFANGNVYAAFASFCDFHATPSNPTHHSSRGWLLGWNGSNLAPLGANQLDDKQGSSPTSFFLDSIWMSGAGIASDESGNLIFSTGNSDGGSVTSSTWDGVTNVQESVVKLSPNLTILGIFSPNSTFGTFSPNTLRLDQLDTDLGSGGVLVIPQLISGSLAATAGKDGRLFLFDRMAMGANSLKFLHLSPISEACWCAPSFFKGPDGGGRVVTSQGSNLHTWHVNSPPSLTQEGTSSISSGQDGGFFTTVSCNNRNGAFELCVSDAIIWAVSRPKFSTTTDTGVFLSAFSALVNASGSYPLLFGPTKAGDWPVAGANANIVPTVSNGKVYVASNKLLTIFALRGTSAPLPPLPVQPIASLTSTFAISGILQDVNGSTLTLKTRKGKNRPIDASQAMNNGTVAAALTKGDSFTAVGSSFTPTGSLLADAIYRAKGPPTGDGWPPDKDPGQ